MLLVLAFLAAADVSLAATAVAPTGKLKTFGTGRSAFSHDLANAGLETSIFSNELSSGAEMGAMNHFWTTGDTDNLIFRYYVDGEAEASVQFTAPKAAGAFFADPAMWGTGKNGKGGSKGGWFVNYKVPFGKRINITIQGPVHNGFVIVRGCENLPITVGSVLLPPTARMKLLRIENVTFAPLAWVPIVDLPSGEGLVYMTAISASSASVNFWEGCYHLYTPYNQSFPGTVLSTGMEDFFDSAYGFGGGEFKYPVSGCTHRDASKHGMKLSAYRFHEEDPIAFSDGIKFQWRIGDLINPKAHPESPKCFIDQPGPGDKVVGRPMNTTVTTYAWVYTW